MMNTNYNILRNYTLTSGNSINGGVNRALTK